MLRRFLIALLFLFIGFSPVLGQTEFLTDYRVDYIIRPDGLTQAQLNINLINQLSNIYAKEFTLSIGSTKLSEIRVTGNNQQYQPQIIQGNKTTNITIPFPEKVVGKDKAQVFKLEFISADFSQRLGNIWEISIPRLSKTDNLRDYQLTLTVPNNFGPPSTMTPAPAGSNISDQVTIYRFNSTDLFDQGITATFGVIQYFDFDLKYHLENMNVFPIKTEIALPPDTAWQTVVYASLNPPPENIVVDRDGNWLASYLLNSKQSLTVVATGSASIQLQPKTEFSRGLDEAVNYLSRQKYWEIDSPKIVALAQKLATPANIYQYLVDNLIYDYGRITDSTARFGAANALDNPTSAICMEFTDLFVALARAAGIPSRAVNGFAYTTNSSLRPLSLKKDILHAWPEYFDSSRNLWIPIDPTWGNTTGGVDFFNHPDLNHFTFVLLGADSQYPIPAGAYKTNKNQAKDVLVDFGQAFDQLPQLEITLNLPATALAGVPLKGEIILKNIGNIALYRQAVKLIAPGLNLTQSSWEIPVLPPYARINIPLEIAATDWTYQAQTTLSLVTDLAVLNQNLTIQPVYELPFHQPKQGLYLLLAFVLILSAFFLKKIYNKLRR
jgi:hypothetical protein